MQILHFELALLPAGWSRNVEISIDSRGDIADVLTGVAVTRGTPVPGCVLPGMPNVHSHAHQRAMAGLAEYPGPGADSFWSWRTVMYDCVNKVTPAQMETIAAQLYIEMLKSGYTSVAEFQYLHHDADGVRYDSPAEMSLRTCNAARTTGIGMTSLPVLYGYSDFGEQPPHAGQKRFVNDADRYLTIYNALVDDASGDLNAQVGVAPHSLRAVSREVLNTVLDQSCNATHPIHIHIAEQTREVDACKRWSGQRPVQWLLSNFEVDHRWCLIHATHMDSAEIRDLARSGAVAGLCPTTEANLGDGIVAAKDFLAAGGRFGIGSDSHISVSPVEELRWLEYGQRLVHRARNVLAPEDGRTSTGRFLFEAAVAGGAQACGRKIGRIESGYRADLITLDTGHPLLYARNGDALLDSWIFSGNSNAVRDVFVGGRQVVVNREHPMQGKIAVDFKKSISELAAAR
jgi:formimidoylglutamate deiminase